jgi:hypothetical protein
MMVVGRRLVEMGWQVLEYLRRPFWLLGWRGVVEGVVEGVVALHFIICMVELDTPGR